MHSSKASIATIPPIDCRSSGTPPLQVGPDLPYYAFSRQDTKPEATISDAWRFSFADTEAEMQDTLVRIGHHGAISGELLRQRR